MLEERLDEHRKPGRLCGRGRGDAAHCADLPQNEGGGPIDTSAVDEEVGRLVALATKPRRVDAEVGEEAVLRRDARKHARHVALGSRHSDRLVRRGDEDARVAVEGCDDVLALADVAEDLLRHGLIRLGAALAEFVKIMEGTRLGVQSLENRLHPRFGDERQDDVRCLQQQPRFTRQMRAQPNARADDGQRAGRHGAGRGSRRSR